MVPFSSPKLTFQAAQSMVREHDSHECPLSTHCERHGFPPTFAAGLEATQGRNDSLGRQADCGETRAGTTAAIREIGSPAKERRSVKECR